MRRPLSLTCLLLAWLCANGALWNVVQVVAWGRMYADNVQIMSPWRALERTFDGSRPCEICGIAQHAQDMAAKEQSPSAPGQTAPTVLVCEAPVTLVLRAPLESWPEVAPDFGPARAQRVPVPPPRA